MATDLIKAADDARRILKGFKAFAEVADALEAAGQIEQRAVEARKVLADLQPQIEAAKAEAAAAEEQAANTLAVASQQAAKLFDDAKTKASALVDTALSEAATIARQTQAAVKAADDAALEADLKRAAADDVRNALLAECETIEARLAKAKGSIAKLLG